jgi:hypothetical protein
MGVSSLFPPPPRIYMVYPNLIPQVGALSLNGKIFMCLMLDLETVRSAGVPLMSRPRAAGIVLGESSAVVASRCPPVSSFVG